MPSENEQAWVDGSKPENFQSRELTSSEQSLVGEKVTNHSVSDYLSSQSRSITTYINSSKEGSAGLTEDEIKSLRKYQEELIDSSRVLQSWDIEGFRVHRDEDKSIDPSAKMYNGTGVVLKKPTGEIKKFELGQLRDRLNQVKRVIDNAGEDSSGLAAFIDSVEDFRTSEDASKETISSLS